MSSEKRPAPDDLGSQMVVKKPRNTGTAVARVNGSGANGALIQSVCLLAQLANQL